MIKHTLKNGMEITIEVREFYGQLDLVAKDPVGKIIASGRILDINDFPLHDRKKIPIEYRYAIGNLVLSETKGLEVIAAIEAKKAEMATTPEGIERKLRAERQSLVDEINGALDEADRVKARSYESGEGTGQFVFAGKEWEEKADKAKIKLAKFDKMHPEIIAGIKKDRSEAADRHAWD